MYFPKVHSEKDALYLTMTSTGDRMAVLVSLDKLKRLAAEHFQALPRGKAVTWE